MDFEELMAKERSEAEAKKVLSFIKLNCLDGYLFETPLSRKTRLCTIAKYLIDHLYEID